MSHPSPPKNQNALPRYFHSLVRLQPLMAVHEETSYQNAQKMIDTLTSLPELSKGQLEYLDTLTILLEAYENEHHNFDESTVGPLEALRHLLSEHSMTGSDLGRLLGERSLGAKILRPTRTQQSPHQEVVRALLRQQRLIPLKHRHPVTLIPRCLARTELVPSVPPQPHGLPSSFQACSTQSS